MDIYTFQLPDDQFKLPAVDEVWVDPCCTDLKSIELSEADFEGP